MHEADEAFGEELLKAIEELPKETCTKCGYPKPCCLFTPSQLARKKPVCRMCVAKPRNG